MAENICERLCAGCPLNDMASELVRYDARIASGEANIIDKARVVLMSQVVASTENAKQKIAAIRTGNFKMKYECDKPKVSFGKWLLTANGVYCDAVEIA